MDDQRSAVGKLSGVREGSVIAAILVGNMVKVYNWTYDKFVGNRQA